MLLVALLLWWNFDRISGNICDLATARSTCNDVDYVLHNVALGKKLLVS